MNKRVTLVWNLVVEDQSYYEVTCFDGTHAGVPVRKEVAHFERVETLLESIERMQRKYGPALKELRLTHGALTLALGDHGSQKALKEGLRALGYEERPEDRTGKLSSDAWGDSVYLLR